MQKEIKFFGLLNFNYQAKLNNVKLNLIWLYLLYLHNFNRMVIDICRKKK